MFEELMKHKEFNALNSLSIFSGVELKNQKRFPIWLSWWEQGNAGIPNQLVEMGILKFDDYRDDIDRFFELGDFSIWDLIDEAAGSQKNTSSNSADSQQEFLQSNNTTDIMTEITAQNTPKKSVRKGKEEEDKSAIEKEFRQNSKQEVAGWLIDHDFPLTRKNVPGFLAVELLEALHIAVTKRDLLAVQKYIKQGGDAIGDILKLPLKDSNITLLDVVNFQLDDTSQEEPSTKKGRNQKKAKRGKQLTNTKDPQLIEIKKALEAVMPQGNSNSQETNISENSGNSENMEKGGSENGDLEQNRANNAQSAIKSNEKTETGKGTPRSESEVQTGEIETKTDKKTDPQSPQAEPKETTQTESKTFKTKTKATKIESPKSKKELSYQRKEEKRKKEQKEQEKLERERQERQKALENQQKAEKKVEKTEKLEKVEKTGKAERLEIIEKTQKTAEQKDQKIETISKSFQRNESISQKQELSLFSLNFKDVNEGKRIKIKAIPLPEDIMGTKIDKEIQTTNLGLLPQSPNSKFNKLTQTPRAWQQRQIIRVNPPRLQFFHDETYTISVVPNSQENRMFNKKSSTFQVVHNESEDISVDPNLWEARERFDRENYRIFEEIINRIETTSIDRGELMQISPNGQNIIHFLAWSGNLSHLQYLYDNYPDVFNWLKNLQDMGAWTALHLAVKYEHGEVVYFLLQHGADPYIKDRSPDQQSALDLALNHYRSMLPYFQK